MRRTIAAAIALGGLLGAQAFAYPLDGWEETQIHRLKAYDMAKEPLLKRGTLKPGSVWSVDQIRLRLLDHPDFQVPPPDPMFTNMIKSYLGPDAAHYGIAVLDISDPSNPRYAEIRGTMIQNPGSVGKIVVALAIFQALADVYPDDIAARQRVLLETEVTANEFIRTDHHVVPLWSPGDPRVAKRPIQEGDQANLWTFLDWMASASSNAGAAMVMSQLVLLKHFGADYPVSEKEAKRYFEKTPKSELQATFLAAIVEPLGRSGLNSEHLRQGSFFTREGKKRVPGTNSLATARELMRFMLKMEQGKLVDEWSSLQIKRLLYLTDRRIRYASHPALNDSAVYFKSGSLYSCQPEPGFECEKYHGNRVNFMNSVATVEYEGEGQSLHYIAVVLSNVLRKNSAVEHQTLAARIHRLVQSMHPAVVDVPIDAPPENASGAGGS